MQDTFNLLIEKWIPVLRVDGRPDRIGIRQAFHEAGSIRQIAASNPMDNVALLRFLLAVLYWCKGNPIQGEKDDILAASQFPMDWFSKLDQQEDCFNLLGDGKRFYQDREALNVGKSRPVGDLLIEFPTETKIAHFRHVRDQEYGLCPPCCALGTIRFCAWANAYGGGRYTSAVNGPAPAYSVSHGDTLLHTLTLNWTPVPPETPEPPPWQSGNAPKEINVINVFAWRSRGLWLGNPGNSDDSCAYCGRPAKVIRKIVFTGGWKPPFETKGQQKKFWDKDPHLIFEERLSADESHQEVEAIKQDNPSMAPDAQPGTPRRKKKDHESRVLTTLGFPSPSSSVTTHARFWRRALRAMLTRLETDHAPPKAIVGPAANKGLYQDAVAVSLPTIRSVHVHDLRNAVDAIRLCVDQLPNVLKRSTPNPDRQHPNRKACLDALTADMEATIRNELFNRLAATSAGGADNWRNAFEQQLHCVVQAVVHATTTGSPLRRREAVRCANSWLDEMLRKLSAKPGIPPETGIASQSSSHASVNLKARRKKEGRA